MPLLVRDDNDELTRKGRVLFSLPLWARKALLYPLLPVAVAVEMFDEGKEAWSGIHADLKEFTERNYS